ncbi:hypothetical protein [Actinoplanes sp. DH11]|uniref:hypothetical protein n=1 Tax=Actinoplanes sp. DH11 TaxID=2857011 RepID=UPI001E565D37|nr:hypothetical protein [Actinoplanes sp. DH11]
MSRREYDPAQRIHALNCPDAPPGAFVSLARTVGQTYPHDRPHRCVTRAYTIGNGPVVREAVSYPPHQWVPSSIVPSDAVRALCRICRGTRCATAQPPAAPPITGSGLVIPRG